MILRFTLLAGCALVTPIALAAPPTPLPPAIEWKAAPPVPAPAADGWDTPAERSGFVDSPDLAGTLAFLRRLQQQSPWITLHRLGQSAQGRELMYVRASKGGRERPVVMVQAGIHAGEIDGKDAGLMLLRDIAVRGRGELLDAVDLVFVPVLNADAHEAASAFGRPSQRGPRHKGTRTSAQGLDLNRDYARLESPEVRAVVQLLRTYDPALYIDVHVSDGTDYQYDVTWAFAGWGTYARSRATAGWLMDEYSDDLQQALTSAGHQPAVYPSWVNEDVPSQGLRISIESPRYSTGYGDFIGVPTVLVENHRFKPYRQRVLGTYVLLERSLRSVARDADRIAAAKRDDRAARAEQIAVRWERDPVPLQYRSFAGYGYEERLSAASGARELRWTGQPQTRELPVYGTRVTEVAQIPAAWWIPPGHAALIDLLAAHGIRTEVQQEARSMRLQQVQMANGLQRDGFARSETTALMPAGSVRVPADQPLQLLAATLLEPSSQDSVLAMGWYDRALPGESPLPRHLAAALADAMMAADAGLRAQFEQALATDAAFAADPQARLRWWEVRSPYGKRTRWIYPVLSELR